MDASSPFNQGPRVILIAPNVSEQMGGEAIKALQIYQELERLGIEVHQITHDRVKRELDEKFPRMHVTYIKDTLYQRFLWRTRILRPLLNIYFNRHAAKLAMQIAAGDGRTVLHYTSPVSPVIPIFRTPEIPVIVGPINGQIYNPPSFRHRDHFSDRVRRRFHSLAQRFHRLLFRGKRDAEVLLVAGGQRTRDSLLKAGCHPYQFADSIDSGVEQRLYNQPRITHEGKNLKFVHNGRLVKHKGADLAIKALARTRNPIELEIIGRGPERKRLEKLARKLFVSERVKFTPWIKDHSKLPEIMRQYRAFVFPSLAEANGIVVQEAMTLGLLVICIDWGGPSLLVDSRSGYAIRPVNEDFVVAEIARAMDELCENPDKAESMSKAARDIAVEKGFLWPDIAKRWSQMYENVTGANTSRVITARPLPRHTGVKIEIESIDNRPSKTGLLSEALEDLEGPTVHIES